MNFPNESFNPFFDAQIAYEGARDGRKVRGTFAACIFPAEKLDAFADTDADANRFKCTVLLAKSSWNDVTPPQIGDEVTLENGSEWKVSSVNPHCDDHFELEVRSC